MTRRLIVNADDYGLTEGVSRGILRAATEGIVTSTSVLALAPAAAATAGWLDHHPDVGVGAHLALVGEDPPLLSAREVPSLVDGRGRLAPSWRAFVPQAAAGRIDPADVRRELAAQVARVGELTGRRLTHLDSHQHLHLWPVVRDVVLDLAAESGIPAVRRPRAAAVRPVTPVVNGLSRRLATAAARSGIRLPDDAAGVDDAGHVDGPVLARTLERLATGGGGVVELGVHPGEADDPARDRYRWGYRWADELEALCAPAAREAVARHGFELATYDALAGEGATAAARDVVLDAYADAPRSARAHVRVRWASCPFPAVVAAVPERASVLEVGCGHGLASALLAATSPGRRVLGVDVDAEKIAIARHAATHLAARRPGADLTFEVAEAGRLPEGEWDAVLIVDVLYLLGEPGQRALLAESAKRLAPGGVLVVKEMAATPAWKARWNRTQERLSVRVLGLTAGATLCFVPLERQAAWLEEAGLSVEVRRLDRGSPHPHALLVARRP